jgi:hypothetical protein
MSTHGLSESTCLRTDYQNRNVYARILRINMSMHGLSESTCLRTDYQNRNVYARILRIDMSTHVLSESTCLRTDSQNPHVYARTLSYQDGECWRFIPSKWYFTVEQLASDCCLHPNEQVSAIAWWEQFRWDDNMMSPLWPTQVDFYSASSLKQQSVRRHVDSESPCVDMWILRVRA